MSALFRARYAGRCAAGCGEPIEAGDDVTFVDDRLVHVECADRGVPVCGHAPRPVTICPTCHLTRPCDCEDQS